MISTRPLPGISIVVPSFNQAQFLRENLASIFDQNYPHLEVIVMDGGSTDGSVEIIKQWEPRLTYWQSQKDNGQSDAINQGMRHCTGDIVAWLNSDDFYWKDSLWTVAQAFQEFPDYGMYIGNGFRYKQQEKSYKPFCPHHVAFNRDALINGLDYILQPSTFFLRKAWEEVGGLQEKLHYVMDWDVILRISEKYPVVTINDFLGVSREYAETKTSTGKLRRIAEIFDTIQKFSGVEMTTGGLFYALETLSHMQSNSDTTEARGYLWQAMKSIMNQAHFAYGEGLEWFPAESDPQDQTFIPRAYNGHGRSPRGSALPITQLPSISVVVPSYNQAQFLPYTLDSILSQDYPRLEVIVMDGNSTDASVGVLQEYTDPKLFWVSEPDAGPANAINRGFKIASGDILAWLNSDDTYTTDALWEVAAEFARDPDLDVVIANALYVDEQHHLYLAHHGTHRTGMYYGKLEPYERIPAYWEYVYAVPQPTVFFRRRALENAGGKLDETLKFIFDFELIFRLAKSSKIKKIERVNALYRIHSQSKTGGDWTNFLVELYRFSRPRWYPRRNRGFWRTLRSYLSYYMKRKYGYSKRNWRFWLETAVIASMVITRIGNPEALGRNRRAGQGGAARITPKRLPPELYQRAQSEAFDIQRHNIQYTAFFCSLLFPRYPGHSGGEIRDFHIIKHLLASSTLRFFSLYEDAKDTRSNLLYPYLDRYITAESLDFYNQLTRKVRRLMRKDYHFHRDANVQIDRAKFLAGNLQQQLEESQPDFLFVSPQSNPVALMLDKSKYNTRFIFATYDVEAVRVKRIAEATGDVTSQQASLAEAFERENLAAYDGILAVSELDKQIFVEKYQFPSERILVIENSVDLNYFKFEPRVQREQKNIVYIGSLSYFPNEEAAWRLIERIMPLVRQKFPDACLWVVGQGASEKLAAMTDNQYTVVTGKVEDVRPYLAYADLTCVPLMTGSGTKYKILEAFSAGVPVVCSSIAAEGLDLGHEVHALIGDSDEELAERVIRMLSDSQMADELTRNAYDLVTVQYSWRSNLSKLDQWLAWLAKSPPLTSLEM